MVREERDWKDALNSEDRELLRRLILRAKKHRLAYENADDVKVAQLWTALVEMQKEINELKEILGKISAPFKAIAEVGEKAKRKEIERLIAEIVRPTDEETQEATRKLVDSLMKF
jgi:hypothetical protein